MGIQIMETLAVGAFLTALAVELGASNFTIGALAAIPHLSQLAQIPALFTVERIRRRRAIYLASGMIARPMMLVIGAAALIPNADWALAVIVAAFALRYGAGAFLGCAWSSWMRDLVPEDEMGRLFSSRQRRMIAVGIVGGLLAAAFIDGWQKLVPLPEIYAYTVVYALAFLGGAYSVYCSRKIFEPPMGEAATDYRFLDQLRAPFRDVNFRKLLGFLSSWNFATNLAAPFFTVHMLKRMELDLLWVIGLATLSQISAYLMVSQWGAIADRFNNRSVLRVCVPLFVLCIFAWTFTTMPEKHALTVPLLVAIHVLTGIASAGATLASGNIALKLAPKGNATGYLAVNSLVNASAAGVAAMFGGLTADLFASWELSLTINWRSATHAIELSALSFSYWDFFFFFATLVGLFALNRLRFVEERGDVNETTVLETLVGSAREGLRNLSTVAGLREATQFPVDLVEREIHEEGDRAESDPPAPTRT